MQIFPIDDALSHAPAAARLIALFASFAQTAAPAAVTALWQGAAVAAGLAISLRIAPRVSAAHRFTAWAAAFAVVVCLPLVPLLAHFSSPASALPQFPAHPILQLDARWTLAIAALWFAASAFRAVDLALHSLRLRKLWNSATPVSLIPAHSLTAHLGVQAEICTTPQLARPSVIGFFAPRILIPDWLFARLTPGELRQIVLHEAQHLRRRDDWTNLLQKLSLVVFPLNPALAFIERRLCREREMACDEAVVRLTQAPRAYAACLASIAERGLQHRAQALSLGAFERRPELVHRVHSILRGNNALTPIAGPALLVAVAAGLILGSFQLVRCPQIVAFIPAQDSATLRAQATQPELIRASYSPARQPSSALAAPRYRATSVLAILPPSRPVPATRPVSRQIPAQRVSAPAEWPAKSSLLASAAPRQPILKAEIPSPNSSGQPQQWIVFTSWQQVQTSSPSTCVTADYDTAANQQPSSASQPSNIQTQFTITRLILRVYPADSAADSPSSGQPSSFAARPTQPSTPISVPRLPAALPFATGWLFIQL